MSVREAAVLLVVGLVAAASASSKPVHITLTSNWSRTPILLEASEFLSGEDPLLFWEFLEKTEDLHSAETERDVYEAVMEVAEQLLPPLVFNCLQLSLSLHAQSPAVTMYQQLAEERRSSLEGGDCLPWVELGGKAYCSLTDLISELGPDTPTHQPEIYSFDHVYPTVELTGNQSSQLLPVAILYCQWGSQTCRQWHHQLADLASQGSLRYVFRHHFQVEEEGGTVLSGYGVELAVKNSEYKAVDDTKVEGEKEVEEEEEVELDVQGFSFPTLQSLHKDLSEKLDEFRQHLQHSAREIPDLKAWQVQDLGFQAAQRVANSPPDMALSVLRDLAQNLPTMTRTLSRVAVKKDLRSEVTANQRSLQKYGMDPGDSFVLFNGIVLQTETTDSFSVLELLMAESHLIGGLTGLGLSVSDAHSVVQFPVHSQATSFAVDMRSPSVVFINNLESDEEYAGWSKSLKQFMQPSFPGSLKQVARNVFNLVFCLDPAGIEGIELVEYMALFLENRVPVRLGILLVSEEDNEVGVAISRGFYYIVEHHSAREALNWLLEVQSNLTVEGVNYFMETEFPDAPADIFTDTSAQEEMRMEVVAFFSAKGLRSLPQVLLNGVQLDLDEDLEAAIVNQLQQQTYLLQKWIYMKKVADSTDIYEYFMTRPNILKRLNHHITAADTQNLDLSAALPVSIPQLSQFHSLGSQTMSALLAHHMTYYTGAKDEFAVRSVSLWVVADLDSEQGRLAARSALSHLAESSAVQVGFLHNPLAVGDSTSDLVRSVVAAELKGWTSVSLLLSLLSSSPDPPPTLLSQAVNKSESDVEEAMGDRLVEDVIAAHTLYCKRILKLRGGQTAILSNGRLVGPLEEDEAFSEQDYSMLVQLENSSHAHAVVEAVGGVAVDGVSPDDDTSSFRSRLVLKVSSLLRSQQQQRRIPRPSLKDKHSVIHLPAPEPVHHILTAVLDPLDPSVQKWAHLLKVLQVVTPCDITIILNPQNKLSEVPIKSFYRYVLEPELSFTSDGAVAPGPRAIFSQLPHSPLLTLHMDVPHAWLVAAVHSPHDLDNIHLQSVESGVQAEFLLEHILVEGQLYDASSNQPVPGLELVLGPPSQPNLYDTVVMANLGYFQLKASPGAWQLQIREGRSRDIYTIAGHSGDGLWEKEEDRVSVAVRTFSGEVHIVKVAKRKGMEGVRLLYSEEDEGQGQEDNGGMWATLSSFMGGGGEEDGKKKDSKFWKNETINVFSIASGHLYERFLRIMMLSVLKHTTHPVKFWFLENYLSPTFKDFIPHMASHYGFQYELVQYKWPRWLHQQKEKQRLIWGYKILFLDVLFPLSVKHIIFVDADQMVRADLAELLEVPLDGAPYGYTPFCNDRPEMEGFQFWERGYWKSHLGNRRYHISALYVVDLLRFRQLAAGDRLRGQYQALSQDPNSLANLDQDLPNNMIHQVPIKSLPQEWLWCETWCSEASKPAAKTIDLCNNPLTKEPKLTSAMRILPEWSGYDQEIRELQEAKGSTASSKQTPLLHHKHSEL